MNMEHVCNQEARVMQWQRVCISPINLDRTYRPWQIHSNDEIIDHEICRVQKVDFQRAVPEICWTVKQISLSQAKPDD